MALARATPKLPGGLSLSPLLPLVPLTPGSCWPWSPPPCHPSWHTRSGRALSRHPNGPAEGPLGRCAVPIVSLVTISPGPKPSTPALFLPDPGLLLVCLCPLSPCPPLPVPSLPVAWLEVPGSVLDVLLSLETPPTGPAWAPGQSQVRLDTQGLLASWHQVSHVHPSSSCVSSGLPDMAHAPRLHV